MNQEKQKAQLILAEYSEKTETKLDRLQALDRKVKTPAEVFAYIFGIAGALILGVGMCLAMKVIGASLAGNVGMILGVIIGVIGIAVVSVNYFIYRAIFERRKKKYGAQIIALSNELLGDK